MELYGKLIMNDDGEFELDTEREIINISKLLDGIYNTGSKPQIYIKIEKFGRLLFEEDGLLVKKKDEQNVESYFICGMNLSKLLFYETDEALEVVIKERKCSNNEQCKYTG
jgi:hypothetical protein